MSECPFCKINKTETVLFTTEHFLFLASKLKITECHHLLIAKKHLRTEIDFTEDVWRDYREASRQAWDLMKKLTGQEPLIFINPPQMQSVGHFHKHYVDGVFGIHGVANALRLSLV